MFVMVCSLVALSWEPGWLAGSPGAACDPVRSPPYDSRLAAALTAHSRLPRLAARGDEEAAHRPIVQRQIPTKTTRSQAETKEYIFF